MAADKTSVSGLIEQAAVAARVDPEVGKRQAESALELLRRDPECGSGDPCASGAVRLLLGARSGRGRAADRRRRRRCCRRRPAPGCAPGCSTARVKRCRRSATTSRRARCTIRRPLSPPAAHDDQMLAEVLFSSGYLRALRGEYAAGLTELRRAQSLFEQQQMPQHALAALDSIAITYNRMGDYAEAAHLFQRALEAQHKCRPEARRGGDAAQSRTRAREPAAMGRGAQCVRGLARAEPAARLHARPGLRAARAGRGRQCAG